MFVDNRREKCYLLSLFFTCYLINIIYEESLYRANSRIFLFLLDICKSHFLFYFKYERLDGWMLEGVSRSSERISLNGTDVKNSLDNIAILPKVFNSVRPKSY